MKKNKDDLIKLGQDLNNVMKDVNKSKKDIDEFKLKKDATTKSKSKNFVHIKKVALDRFGNPVMPDQRDSRIPR